MSMPPLLSASGQSILPYLGIRMIRRDNFPLYDPVIPQQPYPHRQPYPYSKLDSRVFRDIYNVCSSTREIMHNVEENFSTRACLFMEGGQLSSPHLKLYKQTYPDLSKELLHELRKGLYSSSFLSSHPWFSSHQPLTLISPELCPAWLRKKRYRSVFPTIITKSLSGCGFFLYGHFFNILIKVPCEFFPQGNKESLLWVEPPKPETLILKPSFLLVFKSIS